MKRLEFNEQGFRVVTYNPGGGWIAYIFDTADQVIHVPLVFIRGLKNHDDAFLKIGAEIGYLIMAEVKPDQAFNGDTKSVDYGGA